MRKLIALFTALALWAAPVSSATAEPIRDPLSYPLKQYGLVLAVALLGGFVSWVAKVKAGTVRGWNIMALVGELCTSALAGLLCFWVCEWREFPPLVTVSLVGISGHMGTRAIFLAERWVEKRWGSGDASAPAEPRPPKIKDTGHL